MTKKIFDEVTSSNQVEKEPQLSPATTALLHAISERSTEDPLIGAKIGSQEIFERLSGWMDAEKGVHIQSLLCALGALAGYSCQANLRAQAQAKGMPETAPFQVVSTREGKNYFFGDPLNNALAGPQYSIWSLTCGAAHDAGCVSFPDLDEIFQHTSSVLGSDQFGSPRIPPNHRAGDLPINYLTILWPALFPTVKLFCPDPEFWPVLFGLAIQKAISTSKDIINPEIAVKIVMESAVPMSKVDLFAPNGSINSD